MRNRFDQLGKQIGQEALGASGPTVAHDEISPDAQRADLRHEPDPARQAERARLGLLGRLAAVLCLIEIFGHAPDEDEEQEFIVTMYNTWEKAREIGLEEGLKKGQFSLLVSLLRARFGELPAAVIARIEAARTAELERWAVRVLSAKTLAEVLGEPS